MTPDFGVAPVARDLQDRRARGLALQRSAERAARLSVRLAKMAPRSDLRAVAAAGKRVAAWVRQGNGPYILEMLTYRYRGHSMSDPAKYRTKEEVEEYKSNRDPIEHLKADILGRGLATEDDLKAIDKDIKAMINDAAEFAKESPEPDASELWTDVVW